MKMRSRVAVAVVFVASTLVSTFAACGLDESGIVVNDASTSGDVNKLDVGLDAPLEVSQGCLTLDASACFDAALPTTWTYVALADGNQACPGAPGDYQDAAMYYFNPQAEAGACGCGTCATTGNYGCAASIHAGTGNPSCSNPSFTFEAGSTAECVATGGTDPHLAVGPIPSSPTGTVGCDASTTTYQLWSATAETWCAPNCTADYCHAGAFQSCVASTTETACFGPFTQQKRIGPASAVNVTCSACSCQVTPTSSCTATVQAFSSPDCGTGSLGNVVPDGSCPNLGGGPSGVESFLYTPTVPGTACTMDAGVGSAGFTQFITVCCIP